MIIINRVLLVHLLLCQVPIGVEVSQLNAGCRELPAALISLFPVVCVSGFARFSPLTGGEGDCSSEFAVRLFCLLTTVLMRPFILWPTAFGVPSTYIQRPSVLKKKVLRLDLSVTRARSSCPGASSALSLSHSDSSVSHAPVCPSQLR